MVACEGETEVCGAEGLAFLGQAGILLRLYKPKARIKIANKHAMKTDSHSSNCSLCPRPTISPNSKLPRSLGRRFSFLEQCYHCVEFGCHIYNTMARAQPSPESQRRRAVLLALPAHCLQRQAAQSHFPTNIHFAPTVLHCLLRRVRIILGGVWAGVVGAEEEERISAVGGRG